MARLAESRGLNGTGFGQARTLNRRATGHLDVNAAHRQIAGVLASIGAHHANDDLEHCLGGLRWWLNENVSPVGFRHAVEAASRRRGLPAGIGQVTPDDPKCDEYEEDGDDWFHVFTAPDVARASSLFRLRKRRV